MERDQAWAKLAQWTRSESLRRHARAVELVMRAAAWRYGAGQADVETFGLAGLLHDADYEQWPELHPRPVVAWLREHGEEAVAHAISAHYSGWGVAQESALDRALLVCDELTGFVVACCLIRPDGIASLSSRSVHKRLQDKRFAAKIERSEEIRGAELLAVPLDVHVSFILEASRLHAAELGLAGRPVLGRGSRANELRALRTGRSELGGVW